MKIIGITRVRNEEDIIINTLNHVSKLVDNIIVCDDASTDNTVELCKNHPKVISVIENKKWGSTPQDRHVAEGKLRQLPYIEAVNNGADWVYYFDADEYIDFNNVDFNSNIETYYFRLFDYYITEGDVDKNYLEREYIGPEYRDIPMLFKVNPNLFFNQRIPIGYGKKTSLGGYVKHYGKAISIEEWDRTCEYYINHRWKNMEPSLLKRWQSRVGKAIHSKSDFGRDLITWGERFDVNKIVKI